MRFILCLALAMPLLVAAGPATVVDPGQWRTTVRMIDVSAPGMPPGALAGINSSMSGNMGPILSCISPAQAARPNFLQGRRFGDCRYTAFNMSDGRVTGTMVCNSAGVRQTIQLRGLYTRRSYQVTSTSDQVIPGFGSIRSSSEVISSRVGPCNGRS